MILQGLMLSKAGLVEVIESEFEKREAAAHERLRTIKEHDLIATRLRFQQCKCEQHGLYAGMTVDALLRIHGCAPGWVCPRLNSLRRMYGH